MAKSQRFRDFGCFPDWNVASLLAEREEKKRVRDEQIQVNFLETQPLLVHKYAVALYAHFVEQVRWQLQGEQDHPKRESPIILEFDFYKLKGTTLPDGFFADQAKDIAPYSAWFQDDWTNEFREMIGSLMPKVSKKLKYPLEVLSSNSRFCLEIVLEQNDDLLKIKYWVNKNKKIEVYPGFSSEFPIPTWDFTSLVELRQQKIVESELHFEKNYKIVAQALADQIASQFFETLLRSLKSWGPHLGPDIFCFDLYETYRFNQAGDSIGLMLYKDWVSKKEFLQKRISVLMEEIDKQLLEIYRAFMSKQENSRIKVWTEKKSSHFIKTYCSFDDATPKLVQNGEFVNFISLPTWNVASILLERDKLAQTRDKLLQEDPLKTAPLLGQRYARAIHDLFLDQVQKRLQADQAYPTQVDPMKLDFDFYKLEGESLPYGWFAKQAKGIGPYAIWIGETYGQWILERREEMSVVRDHAFNELAPHLASLSSDPRYCLEIHVEKQDYNITIKWWVRQDSEVKVDQDLYDMELPDWKSS
jgi:hypothetical protein